MELSVDPEFDREVQELLDAAPEFGLPMDPFLIDLGPQPCPVVTMLEYKIGDLEQQVATLKHQLCESMTRESQALHRRIADKHDARARLLYYHACKSKHGTVDAAAWRTVKHLTDAEFASLTDVERQRFMDQCVSADDWNRARQEARKQKGLKNNDNCTGIFEHSDEMAPTASKTSAPRSRARASKAQQAAVAETSVADVSAVPAQSCEAASCGLPTSSDAPHPTIVINTSNEPTTVSLQIAQQNADDSSASGSGSDDVGSSGATKDVSAYVTALRRISRSAKKIQEHLKSKGDADGRKLVLEIVREANKAMSTQESRQTGYQLFIKLNSPKFRKEIEANPEHSTLTKGAHTQLVFRKIAESWRSLDEAQKKHYNDMVNSGPQAEAVSA